MKQEKNFSEFGSDVTPEYKRRRKARRILLLLLLLGGFIFPLAYVGWTDLYTRFLEQEAPTISLPVTPEGIGNAPRKITIRVEDRLSGLDEVIVRSKQGNVIKDILRQSFSSKKTNLEEIEVILEGRKEGFLEGDITLQVIAFDKSFFSNKRFAQIYLTVDYSVPQPTVITTQHNAVHGGAQLVFYSIMDGDKSFVGQSAMTMGEYLFPGFPAAALDNSFARRPDIHFTFFPVPLEVDPETERLSLFVRDAVGNTNSASLYYRIREVRRRDRRVTLNSGLLKKRVEELYEEFMGDNFTPATSADDIVARFQQLNVDYRAQIESSLSMFFASPKLSRYWQGPFARPVSGKVAWRFGDRLSYSYLGGDAGTRLSKETFFRVSKLTEVRAANDGLIIFADPLGIFGNTVVVDHGLGLVTLYAHLDSIEHREGKSVSFGDILGTVGTSGLTDESGLLFQVRLHGEPVRPTEWWDKKWIKEHIDSRIKRVKKTLGIISSVSLPPSEFKR